MTDPAFFYGKKIFFGRRKGPSLSARQQGLINEQLPAIAFPESFEEDHQLSSLFKKTCQNYQLEIGFGGGEHLLHLATENPHTGFIGVEPFMNGMVKILSAIHFAGLNNIRLHSEDAGALIDRLPSASIDRIYLLYPDPWPKKRHWKRRFVNEINLNRFARVLCSGGLFRFACDVDSYTNWTLNQGHKHAEFTWQAQKSCDWKTPWTGWRTTRYEQKALREGRVPCYLTFVRK